MPFPGLAEQQAMHRGTRSAPVLGTGVEVFRPCDTGPAVHVCVRPGAAGAASTGVGWLGTGVLPVASQPCSPCSETAEQVKPFYMLAAKESVPGEQGCMRACPPPNDILLALPLV